MNLAKLHQRFRTARADRSRRSIADLASAVHGAPADIGEAAVRWLESGAQVPPPRGDILRAVAAALGVPMIEVLEDLGYWPPLRATQADSRALLETALRLGGWHVTRANLDRSIRIIIEVPNR